MPRKRRKRRPPPPDVFAVLVAIARSLARGMAREDHEREMKEILIEKPGDQPPVDVPAIRIKKRKRSCKIRKSGTW